MQKCETCGTINGPYRQTCVKCGNLLEEDLTSGPANNLSSEIPYTPLISKPPPSTPPIGEMQLGPDDFDSFPPLPISEKKMEDIGASSNPGILTQPSFAPITKKRSLVIISLFVVAVLLIASFSYLRYFYHTIPIPTNSTPVPRPSFKNGIGIFPDEKGENIGVSDGSFALDVGAERPGTQLKTQASESFKAGDIGRATALWNQAHAIDSSDAETLIYLEDQRVIASGRSYVTIVIGSVLADNPIDYASRDQLQGAYIAQQERNQMASLSTDGELLIRFLIAKSGNNSVNSIAIAHQIVDAAHADHTIIGIFGWTKTTSTLDVLPIFTSAHIPMMASAVGGDTLNGSLYFFRVTPPNNAQAQVLAKYTESTLNPQRLVVFYDHTDTFSQNLKDDFTHQFIIDGHTVFATEEFKTAGTPEEMSISVKRVLAHSPDVIFIAGSRSTDIGNFLKAIPDTSQFTNLKVITDSTFYPVVDAPNGKYPSTTRVRFVSAAFPDAWEILKPSMKLSAFFTEYPRAFDPNNQHTTGNPYSYRRSNAYVMLAYDSILTLSKGIQIVQSKGKQQLTSDELQQALTEIHGSQTVQGITGQISFGSDHNPMNKEVLVLRTSSLGLQLDYHQGCFFVQDCP